MTTRAITTLAVIALVGCSSGERKVVAVHITGCTGVRARLIVFRGGDPCTTEDPSAHSSGSATPLAVGDWINPESTIPVTIDVSGSGPVAVVVQCGDGADMVREWGCGLQVDGKVDVEVDPALSYRCDASPSCPQGADAFDGAGGPICVPSSEPCVPETDAAVEDAGHEPDAGDLDAGTDASVPPACDPPPQGRTIALEGNSVDLARANPDTIVVASSGTGINVLRGTMPGLTAPFDRYNVQEGYGIAASADHAYVASGNSVEADENNIVTLSIAGDGLLSGDGGLLDPDGDFHEAELLGTLLFTAAGSGGLRIYSVGDPSNQSLQGGVGVGGYAWDLAFLADDFVVLAAGDAGAVVVDAGNPGTPAQAASVPESTGAKAIAADPASGLVLVAREGLGVDVLLWDPGAHTLVHRGTYDTDGTALGVTIARDRGWVADGTNGLVAIDLGAVQPVAHIPSPLNENGDPSFAHAVMIEGNYALVAAETAGVYEIDVSCVP